MRLHLCGVRGSTPAPGPAFARIGGHTSCVAVAHDDDAGPRLVVDGGTGLRRVAELLGEAPFRGSLLLGHLHWDHTQGIPFFTAGDRPDARVAVHLPVAGGAPGHALDGLMSPPFFPIDAGGLRGDWTFHALDEGEAEIEGFTVVTRAIPHAGGRTFGFRITDGGATVAYLSDHGPLALGFGPDGWGPYHDAAHELADGADVLLHDAQYTVDELAIRQHFGHSAIDYAVALAERCRVGRLLLYHHDPCRSDDEVDAIVARHRGASVPVAAAAEGDVIELQRPTAGGARH
jgi:phosphoribosyl 1,2-cyclic phosphodiesterase